jgi:hypothetical protein
MRLTRLVSLCLLCSSGPAVALVLHVRPPSSSGGRKGGGGGGGNGSVAAPFLSVHTAAAAVAASADTDAAATVLLHHGVHTLGGRALCLGGRGGRAVRWVALPGPNREPAIISGGVLVTGWTPASEQPPAIGADGGRLTRWTAPLPAQVAAQSGQPKTMRVGSRRAPQVTFPAVDNQPAATRFLFAREVNASSLVPGAVVVKIDLAALPDGWQTWTSLVAYTYPGNSWVGMRVEATPLPGDNDGDGLASFRFTNAGGFSGLRAGNRVQFAGAPELLGQPGTSGKWAAGTGHVHLLSEGEPEDVWLPVQDRLVDIENRSGDVMSGLQFADTDFVSSGAPDTSGYYSYNIVHHNILYNIMLYDVCVCAAVSWPHRAAKRLRRGAL